jgi:REP-associated tyrosine transposase
MIPNERLHPGHRSLRLSYRDYSAAGIYYVTICAHDIRCAFGRIENDQIESSPLGRIARGCWVAIPSHDANAKLHSFVVMPNHSKGRSELLPPPGKYRTEMHRREFDPGSGPPGSLSAVVRSFKAIRLRFSGEVWHRNYFERVIRAGEAFSNAVRYIAENPVRWGRKNENPEGVKILRPC